MVSICVEAGSLDRVLMIEVVEVISISIFYTGLI